MAGTGEPVVGWLARVVELHDLIIRRYGGATGVLDASLLQAAIERPWAGLANGTQYFPDVLDKASVLLERVINYHPFVDGNKRTAAMLAFEFLREHGYMPEVGSSEIIEVVVKIAEKRLLHADVRLWLDRITTVRLRSFVEPVPCPWCGAKQVVQDATTYSQPGPVGVDGERPATHDRPYWRCAHCGVAFTSSDSVFVVDGARYLLHAWGFGDPLALVGRVVTGPWATEAGAAPGDAGRVEVRQGDVSRAAFDAPTLHLTEVAAALRAKRSR